MEWLTVLRSILVWYVIVQLVALAALPLTLRALRALPDRGYSFAKINGILLVGVLYWLGFSYGLLRSERGGVWVALLAVAAASWFLGWSDFVAWGQQLRRGGRLRAVVAAELVFVLAFVGWALVRAHDPAADHTEQPMDLMFMNSIWASSTFPPQDAWLAGYGISYYYLGYWLLVTLGRLASTPPNIAYNVGQAIWYGYLWVGCFGVVMNLLAWRFGRVTEPETSNQSGGNTQFAGWSLVGGFLGGVAVALIGNMQVILEWLYAQGINIDGLIAWVGVNSFPEHASVTEQWFISYDWWWWRSSRVIKDIDLAGNYMDSAIDEFPMFSYLLGDNHPHVMAMPVVLLVVALAFNLLLLLSQRQNEENSEPVGGWRSWLPLTAPDIVVYLIALGSLVFLNTWDYPPYWLLTVAIVLICSQGAWRRTAIVGAILLVGTVLIYLPYFLTAQSQASGLIPNVFNPTRLPQFLLMFGAFLPALVALIVWSWRVVKPNWQTLVGMVAVVLGVPIAWLALSTILSSTAWGQERLANLQLPEGVSSYAAVIVDRWLAEPWTFLLAGILLSLVMAFLFVILNTPIKSWAASTDVVFVMLLAAVGLGLTFAPEFVFLRDHFGTRMNTIFKFYYQGWMLFGLASAYVITVALRRLPRSLVAAEGLALVSFVFVVVCLLFPAASIYGKTSGFGRSTLTLDATAYVEQYDPDVMAAVQWVKLNTTPDEIVLEGVGNSYAANTDRISTMTGRPTLLGWDGHESQWRGKAFGTMAQGRNSVIETIYRTGPPQEIVAALTEWGINYMFVGPAEIDRYGITSFRLEEIGSELDTVFSRGQVRIFRRRES